MITGNDEETAGDGAPASNGAEPAETLGVVQTEAKAALKAIRARAKAVDKQAEQVEENLAGATAAKAALDASREAAGVSATELTALVEQWQAALAGLEETRISAGSSREEVDAATTKLRQVLNRSE